MGYVYWNDNKTINVKNIFYFTFGTEWWFQTPLPPPPPLWRNKSWGQLWRVRCEWEWTDLSKWDPYPDLESLGVTRDTGGGGGESSTGVGNPQKTSMTETELMFICLLWWPLCCRIVVYFSFIKTGIADAISSFKWRDIYIY